MKEYNSWMRVGKGSRCTLKARNEVPRHYPADAPPMHEMVSKRKLLSANMHMAESRRLITQLYAGDECTDGIESDLATRI